MASLSALRCFQGSIDKAHIVEVRLQERTAERFETIRKHVQAYISTLDRIALPSKVQGWQDVPDLASSVDQILICESRCPLNVLNVSDALLQVHVYQPTDSDSFEEYSNGGGSGDGTDDTMAATVCELPNKNWEGLWDSLIYGDDVKMKLLDYIQATFTLSDAGIDSNLIAWNRVVLLHGPPGTGKTSLCRALAQKLSIRLSHRYSHARLLEINSHSLFSKWFSESGKLVQRLFNSINELIEEEDAFVVVLIDEVESLTAARNGAAAGTEPSDGLRVVNALLTQLDKLRHKKNVLVMSTSNLIKAIDCAFIDRADIVQYIDLPGREAIYDILRTCLCEVMLKGVIPTLPIPATKQVQMYELSHKSDVIYHVSPDSRERSKNVGLRLLNLAEKCTAQGMSGRSLRRLPVLALARFIGLGLSTAPSSKGDTPDAGNSGAPQVEGWLAGMERVVQEMADDLAKQAP
ncbi:P-loop containing nucleoside triphosphate hydrolase protein [Ephemerocybe angulata]|uniref:P-loop containing nucleoside triphosphate hydrolase protein n=1 Tax=Ephemerocybe angulata TaxID=980116 RepID=A0A8H6MEF2_9AGAR|nr:P-loop containing nucleoside triphosphate hydrolase protein [Tulosesus angulatus]